MSADASDVILKRMMSLHPKIIDLTLDRVWRLLAALGHPERALPPVVHIAGTNGKGSTLAMIRAGLQAAGKRVHAYTSPHLVRFHERIEVNGAPIDETALGAVLDECERANGGAPITYFEITTVAALLAFSRTPADFLLLEVGLGGRLDATNIIADPALCVITPVSIDHQQFLGDSLAQIAGEKAGILKRATPCVVARQDDAALEVIETRAAKLGAPLLVHGQHWQVWEEHERLVFQDETGLLDLPRPALTGAHQIDNAGTALCALRALGQADTACAGAMTGARWPARLQRLRQGPLVRGAGPGAELWLDGGHNAAAGQALAHALARMSDRPLHVICAMLNTKDSAGFLRPLAAQIDTLWAMSVPGEPNSRPAAQTAAMARDLGLRANTIDTAGQAVDAIVAQDEHARILICGSLYLAGHILRENG